MKIVLFEDRDDYQGPLMQAIANSLRGEGQVILFEPSENARRDCMHEKQLREELSGQRYSDAALLVVDRDLSAMKHYSGLSEQIVRIVAESLGLPECAYARGEGDDEELVGTDLREGRITVSLASGEPGFADQLVSIARGFKEIAGRLALQR